MPDITRARAATPLMIITKRDFLNSGDLNFSNVTLALSLAAEKCSSIELLETTRFNFSVFRSEGFFKLSSCLDWLASVGFPQFEQKSAFPLIFVWQFGQFIFPPFWQAVL